MLISSPAIFSPPSQSFAAAPQRNVSIDVLKLVLAFMVVGLHTGFLHDVSPVMEYLTGNGLFRIAVPTFLIINGFYFFSALQRGETRRWFGRVIALYSFWMLVYAYFWLPALTLSLVGGAKFLHMIAIGYSHLWYLSGMIGAAVLMVWLAGKSARAVLLVALTLYLAGVCIQYAGNYHVFSGALLDRAANSHWVYRNFLFLCFPFFYIGFAIHKFRLHERISLHYCWFVIPVGLVLLILESYLNFSSPRNDGGFDNLITLLLLCPGIFIVVHRIKLYSSHKQIALYSSGVYLVHMSVLQVLRPYEVFGPTMRTFLVIAISLAITAALVPLSRRARFIL